jgi:hypothetical protein
MNKRVFYARPHSGPLPRERVKLCRILGELSVLVRNPAFAWQEFFGRFWRSL